jgi:hypothetical protein
MLFSACSEDSRPRIRLTDGHLDRLEGSDFRLPDWRFPDGGPVVIPDLTTPGSDRCAGAEPLLFSEGKGTVKGTTFGASNEYGDAVRCGEAASLAGPQRYYALSLKAGLTYRLSLRSEFSSVLYLFSDCSANIINTDCGSAGASGAYSGPIPAGGSGTLVFTAKATGTYDVAVDSVSPNALGVFELSVEEFNSPSYARCVAALPVELSEGNFQGSTLGATNEFGQQITCHLGVDFDGPQVYYSVELQGGAWYRLELEPDFPASLYVTSSLGGCNPANIEVDCGGLTGTVLPSVAAGGKAATAFSPPSSGTYLVVVDSTDPLAGGDFLLHIEAFVPPENMICAAALPLALFDGEVVVKGNTSSLLNDVGAQMICGASPPLLAPQVYYYVELGEGSYRFVLQPSFAATLVLGSSCQTLPADCGSGGLSGAVLGVPSGTVGSLIFAPPIPGMYIVSVDGLSGEARGPFVLQIKRHLPAENGVCGKPEALSLASNPTLEVGNTGPLANDLSGVTCGSPQGPWAGPQAYYRLALEGGKVYTVELSPEATFDPALYAFAASTPCASAAVNVACKGMASDVVGMGQKETLTLAPALDGEVVLVVDSWSPSEVGEYSLSVSWK